MKSISVSICVVDNGKVDVLFDKFSINRTLYDDLTVERLHHFILYRMGLSKTKDLFSVAETVTVSLSRKI